MNHGRPINEASLQYWRQTQYTREDVDAVCRQIDETDMAIRVTFDGAGNINATLTQRTWARQQGHYPTIADFFSTIGDHPAVRGKRGSLIVCIEDGLWEWLQPLSARAPILAFGRHVRDQRTALIPDPAFIESHGYEDELARQRILMRDSPWSNKEPAAFWRGATTGLGIEAANWKFSARGRLTLLAKEIDDSGVLNAKFSKMKNLESSQQELIAGLGLLDTEVPFEEFFRYRYLIDADGYCCAWKSLFLKLASGCATLKIESDYEQWYFRSLVAWKNYIPIFPTLQDFREVYDWLRQHDTEAHKIAREALSISLEQTYERCFDEVGNLCGALLDSFRETGTE